MVDGPFILNTVHYNKIPVKSKNWDSPLKLLVPGGNLAYMHGYTHKK